MIPRLTFVYQNEQFQIQRRKYVILERTNDSKLLEEEGGGVNELSWDIIGVHWKIIGYNSSYKITL